MTEVLSGHPRSRLARAVVDTSVTAAWCFDDEASEYSEAVLEEVVRVGAYVPALWPFEMANVLAVAERRGRMRPEQVGRFLQALTALPLHVEQRAPSSSLPSLVGTARASGLSAYDAAYLELAARTGLQLATRDMALQAAAERSGVVIFEG